MPRNNLSPLHLLFLVATCLIVATTTFANAAPKRLDSRELRAKFRAFVQESPGFSRAEVVIRNDDDCRLSSLQECPEVVQIGGVFIDGDAFGIPDRIETQTIVTNSIIGVFCE